MSNAGQENYERLTHSEWEWNTKRERNEAWREAGTHEEYGKRWVKYENVLFQAAFLQIAKCANMEIEYRCRFAASVEQRIGLWSNDFTKLLKWMLSGVDICMQQAHFLRKLSVTKEKTIRRNQRRQKFGNFLNKSWSLRGISKSNIPCSRFCQNQNQTLKSWMFYASFQLQIKFPVCGLP